MTRKSLPKKFKPDPKNLRVHTERNKSMINASLSEVGGFRSIAADGDGIIRAGNGVYEQAMKLGMTLKPVEVLPNELLVAVRSDLKGRAAERAALFDNATGETSIWDYAGMAALAQREREMLTGIKTESEIEAIIKRAEQDQKALAQGDNTEQESATESAKALAEYHRKWKAKTGDVWRADQHLIFCGDCRDGELLKQIPEVQCIFTSPPYADRREATYGGVAADQYLDWFFDVQAGLRSRLASSGSFLLNIKPHCEKGQRHLYVLELVLAMAQEWDWKLIDELCWLKSPIPGDFGTRFKNAFEPIYHFSPTIKPNVYRDQVAVYSENSFTADGRVMSWGSGQGYVRGAVKQAGLVYPSNVISAFAGRIGGHPATFPTSLSDFIIEAYSTKGDGVLDPFAGSGSTLISSVRLDRIGFAIEQQPEYVSFILERLSWEGLAPERLAGKEKKNGSKRR